MSAIKKQLFEQLALIGRSLSSPQRIELLDYLSQAERSVEELSQLSQLSIANTSRHLQQLKQTGLVVFRKQGKNRLYHLAGDDVVQLIQHLRKTAETHLAEVDRLVAALAPSKENNKEVITNQALMAKIQDEEVTILDVRPEKEYAQGHIKGAFNIPPDKMSQLLPMIPKQNPIVAYCRGPYCIYSYQMLQNLKQQGIQALRLEEGFPEWKASGLPYEQTLNNFALNEKPLH